jgi:hypothetical protein
MTGNERRNKRQMFLKRHHVIRYLWMFVAASAAILGGEQLVAQSNVSAVIEASALTHQVLYSVDVSILDSASLSDPLKLVIESQFGETEQVVYGGKTEGVFENLRANTLYTLRLLINKGFGYVMIAKTSVRTTTGLSGGLSVLFESMDYGHGEAMVSVSIQAYFDDPEEELLGATLRYAVFPLHVYYEGDITDPTHYETITVNPLSPFVTIGPFFNEGERLVLILEGETTSGIVELVNSPFAFPVNFNHSLSVIDAGPDEIVVSAFVSVLYGIESTYEIELWDESSRIATQSFVPRGFTYDYVDTWIHFDRLLHTQYYSLRLIASYEDPISKLSRRVLLEVMDVYTTPTYSLRIKRSNEAGFQRITIDLYDPNHVLLRMGWQLTIGLTGTFVENPIVFEEVGTNRYHASFLIGAPTDSWYRIRIIADKQVNESITYDDAIVAEYGD